MVRFVIAEGHPPGDLHTLIDKELLYLLDQVIVGHFSAAIGLDVDLIDFDLAGDDLPCALENNQGPSSAQRQYSGI